MCQPPSPTFGTPGWLPHVLDEQRACREDVVVFDQTSFSKFVLKGRDALALLQRLCANEIDVPAGRMVYTAMLNARGGFESDLTVVRLAASEFLIITGSSQTTRDFSWIERHIGAELHAALVDVTSAWSVISLMGPKAEALLKRASSDDLSKAALPFAMTREVDVGYARVRAARMSYVGGPGYELYVPTDQCVTLYDALVAAGDEFGLKRCGLLHDRRAARRSRPPRVGRRALARRDAVGSGTRLCGEARQAGAIHRPRCARGDVAAGGHETARCGSPSTTPRRFRGAASRS